MQEFDIRGKTTVTAEVKAQVDDSPLVPPSQQGLGAVENLDAFSESISQAEDAYKENAALMKEFGDMLPDLLKNLKSMSDTLSKFNQNTPRNVPSSGSGRSGSGGNADGNLQQSVLNTANAGSGIVQSVSNTNLTAALLSGLNNSAGAFRNMGRAADSAGGGSTGLGHLLGGLGTGLLVGAAVLKGADALASKYIDEMPTIYGTSKAFGSISDSEALNNYGIINDYNRGTGLRTGEWHNVVQNLRRQGIANDANSTASALDQTGRIAQVTSRWAYATGGDADRYAELAGYMGRYGGSKDVAGDFNYLVSAGKASGLNDTQIPEFLAGIQQVMEDGIAKGFTRSSKEVADTMLMFSKLSGGSEFWKGEQGAKTLQQINNGIASATGLSKTEDILLYTAMDMAFNGKNGRKTKAQQLGKDLYDDRVGYVNTMMLLEQGVNSQNFGAIMDSLSAYGDDEEAKIEALRKMTGLNYTGAMRLYKLNQSGASGSKDFDTQLDKILKDPNNQNMETRNAESLNRIHEAIVELGQKPAEVKIQGQEAIAQGVEDIRDFLSIAFGNNYMDELKNEMTDYQLSYMNDNKNKNLFFDPKQSGLTRAERRKNLEMLLAWNGEGDPDLKTRNYVYETTSDGSSRRSNRRNTISKRGDNYELEESLALVLENQETKDVRNDRGNRDEGGKREFTNAYENFIRVLFADVLSMGNEEQDSTFINEILQNPGKYSNVINKISMASQDKTITSKERDDIAVLLREIYKSVNNITVTEQK